MELPIEQTWLVLVEMLTDLKKRGKEIPSNVNKDVNTVKSLINFYVVDPTHPDRMKELNRINSLTNDIQQELFIIAEEFGDEFIKNWTEKLQKASMGEKIYEEKEIKSRFVVGAPPGFKVSRITFDKPLAEDRVQEISEYHNLITEFEKDEVLVIYGDSDNIKKSIKEFGSFFNE